VVHSGGVTDLGEFLRSRRAALRPADVSVVSYGSRRVPGLRREELAQLAGVSPTYYTRLEQGISSNASDSVLDALARALRLTPDEHQHLIDLARPRTTARRQRHRAENATRSTRDLVHAICDIPVLALDRRNDVLAWNRLGHRLLAGHLDEQAPARAADRPNTLRMLFLDPHTRDLYTDWNGEARRAVASLRLVAGQHPEDRHLNELIGELSVSSDEFAKLWTRHPVHNCTHGTKHLHHPTVGALDLQFTMLQTPDGTGHRLLMLHASPGSPSFAGLVLLTATTCAT
jgi:transcriptional regulator with XRE-family HTH domain